LFKQNETKEIKSFEDSINQKKSDQLMVQEVCLHYLFFLKSTFDSLLSNKIKEMI
jgi:hypothetical protein